MRTADTIRAVGKKLGTQSADDATGTGQRESPGAQTGSRNKPRLGPVLVTPTPETGRLPLASQIIRESTASLLARVSLYAEKSARTT